MTLWKYELGAKIRSNFNTYEIVDRGTEHRTLADLYVCKVSWTKSLWIVRKDDLEDERFYWLVK